jgi:hypothetical protein
LLSENVVCYVTSEPLDVAFPTAGKEAARQKRLARDETIKGERPRLAHANRSPLTEPNRTTELRPLARSYELARRLDTHTLP